MALQVLISHTGQCLETDPGTYGSYEAFRAWIATNAGLSAQNVVFLTAHGKSIKKLQSLAVAGHVFAYDGNIFKNSTKDAKSLVLQAPAPPQQEVEDPPNAIQNENDIHAWQDLFMARRTWAVKLVEDCTDISDAIQTRYRELDVFKGSIAAALENVKSYATTIGSDVSGALAWNTGLQQDYKHILSDIEHQIARLRSCPVSKSAIQFITDQEVAHTAAHGSLEDLVDVVDVRNSALAGKHALASVQRDIAEVNQVLKQLHNGLDAVTLREEQSETKEAYQHSSEAKALLEDIEALATKVSNDYQNALGYASNHKGVSQASRAALLHTRKHLPNLKERSKEMYGLLLRAVDLRNIAAAEHVGAIQAITTSNILCGELTAKLDNIAISKEHHQALDLLQFADRLPVTYASFLAEAIRRHEWHEKVKLDSSVLANEMATFQEEEERRRKKWSKNTGALLWAEKIEHVVPGLEVNLLGQQERWPQASRQELQDYLQTLKSQGFRTDLIAEVAQLATDLDTPTRRQTKRTNTFKNGSVHDMAASGLGQSALMVRGDLDTIRSLQDDKARLENKYKGAESRIRRLEGLLHRQMAQVPTTGSFQPSSMSPDLQESGNPLSSPRLRNDSRRSSTDSRRFSANYGPEEKNTAQKVIDLEAKLIAERERSAGLEKEIAARADSTDNIKHHVKEITSTKQDLLQNLEAQRREFDEERKSLMSNIKEYKIKIEAFEDDVDRLLGSRENEKATIDVQVQALQQELSRERSSHLLETQKAQGQVDFLRNDAKLQRETNEALSRNFGTLQDQYREIRQQAEKSEHASSSYVRTLRSIFSLLRPNVNAPEPTETVSEQVVQLVEDIVSDYGSHMAKLQLAHSERDQAQMLVKEVKAELADNKQKLANSRTSVHELQDSLASKKARFESLEAELVEERDQLSQFRSKFAAGESGSEALRSRLEEEDRRVTRLSDDLAGANCRVGSLEEELLNVQRRHQNAQTKHDTLSERLEARTLRARDLTQRLHAQNERLRRLLERLSYSITREGDSMIIQRIPKTERTSANDSSDPGTAVRRSVSGIPSALADSGDLEHLYWMQNSDLQVETEKYDIYLATTGNFDIEAFCETMLKRVKDLEHTARKLTRDARSYRDKHQRAAKEASEKIAFKNFKDGDLALFLPTRNQATGAWAAFNVGAPHYFLHEQDSHKLRSRDWLLARIHKIEERVVDLAKSMTANAGDRGSIGELSAGGDSFEDDNPFDLSDGLRWYLIEAAEEKPGAPSTPGLGKSTAAITSVDATGVIRRTKKTHMSGVDDVSQKLTRSLDSRRSSSNSKKTLPLLNAPSSRGPASLTDVNAAIKQSPTTTIKGAAENGEGSSTSPPPPSPPKRGDSNEVASTSPSKKAGMLWDSLWSMDLSVEQGKSTK